MTEPVLEDDVVVPLRMQSVVARPPRRQDRRTSVVAFALVAFVGVAVVLGATNIGGPQRLPPIVLATDTPPSPTPGSSPRATARPTTRPVPRATPLPAHLVLGDRVPNERRLVNTDGVHVLDVDTGTVGLWLRAWDDILLPVSPTELVCICLVRDGQANQAEPYRLTLRFQRLDLDGQVSRERDLTTLAAVTPVPDMVEGFNVQAAMSTDKRTIVVALVWRKPPSWTTEVLTIDASTGKVIGSRTIDTVPSELADPSPSPSASETPSGPRRSPDGVYAWASGLAIAPDSRTAFVSINYSEVRNENWKNNYRDWMIPLGDKGPQEPVALAEEARLAGEGWCFRPSFVDADLLVEVCTPPPGSGGSNSFYVRRLETDGTSQAPFTIDPSPVDGYFPTPIIDAANRAVFSWFPGSHQMVRVSLDDGATIVGEVPEGMIPNRQSFNGGYTGGEPSVVLSPDGRLLYALGTAGGGMDIGASSGIWVFDAETVELLDHWEPRALFNSLAVSADGAFVYAAGAPDYDPNGRPSGWSASLTVYDAMSGEVQVIHGQIGAGVWMTFAGS